MAKSHKHKRTKTITNVNRKRNQKSDDDRGNHDEADLRRLGQSAQVEDARQGTDFVVVAAISVAGGFVDETGGKHDPRHPRATRRNADL